MFTRKCYEAAGPFDTTLGMGTDYHMWLRMAWNFHFGYVKEPLIVYRQHPGMLTRKPSQFLQEGIPWEVRVLEKFFRLYPEAVSEIGRKNVARRLSKPYFNFGYEYVRQEGTADAPQLLRRAIGHWPTDSRYWINWIRACFTKENADDS